MIIARAWFTQIATDCMSWACFELGLGVMMGHRLDTQQGSGALFELFVRGVDYMLAITFGLKLLW